MAKEEKETLEKIVTVPLRKEWLKVPRNERGKKVLSTLKTYLSRHMDSENIKISQRLNESLWASGIQKPPSHIKIKAGIDGDTLTAMLPEEIAPQKEKERMEKLKKGMENILPKRGGEKVKEDEKKTGEKVGEKELRAEGKNAGKELKEDMEKDSAQEKETPKKESEEKAIEKETEKKVVEKESEKEKSDKSK